MGVELYGDWGKWDRWAKDRINGITDQKKLKSAMLSVGQRIQNKIQNHIDKQDLGWVPLSPATVRKKGSTQIYVETGEYRNSIKTVVEESGPDSWELIVKPEGTHMSSGLDMQVLGRFLEYGTSKMPARPLWRPVSAEVERMSMKQLIKAMEKAYRF